MINSFCIKTNNNQILDYLLSQFENINLDHIYISNKCFKIYKNVIVHYKGKDTSAFLNSVSKTLCDTIILFYENMIIRKIIKCNYFYFLESEKKDILHNCLEILNSSKKDLLHRKNLITSSCLEFLKKNNSFVLDGLVHFRLKEYIKILDDIVDLAVDKFLLDREYNEFISLLKLYVESKGSQSYVIHLIYSNNESILLDENRNLIRIDDNIFSAKYLSDITFSSNDYALNTLLNMLPQKLYIHLFGNIEDEFINTIKLIFDNRVYICNDCQICDIYKIHDKTFPKVILKD